jgi:hypothetical protein
MDNKNIALDRKLRDLKCLPGAPNTMSLLEEIIKQMKDINKRIQNIERKLAE